MDTRQLPLAITGQANLVSGKTACLIIRCLSRPAKPFRLTRHSKRREAHLGIHCAVLKN